MKFTITIILNGPVLRLNRPLKGSRCQPDPTFTDPADERLHRKQQLAAAFRVFAKFGYNLGASGHISARDPELTDHFWINPLAVPFGRIRVSDLQLISPEGEIVIGDQPINTAGWFIHSQLHAARPDVISAAHAHAVHGKAWSSLGRSSTRSPRTLARSTAAIRCTPTSTA